AAELERRWNVALERVRELETRIGQCSDEQTDPPADQEFSELASELQTVWENPGSDIRLKKRIVQTLIQEIVADVDATGGGNSFGNPLEGRRPYRVMFATPASWSAQLPDAQRSRGGHTKPGSHLHR